MSLPVTRRDLIGTSAALAVLPLPSLADESSPPPSSSAQDAVSLTINGEMHKLSLDRRTSLLDALRERLERGQVDWNRVFRNGTCM